MDFKTINPLWGLSDPLTVLQAAALVGGTDPNEVRFDVNHIALLEDEAELSDTGRILWVKTAFAAMTNAITGNKLSAVLRYSAEPRYTMMKNGGFLDHSLLKSNDDLKIADGKGVEFFVKQVPDWASSTVSRDDLIAWLKQAGIQSGFFFPMATEAPDYLDPQNPRYAPKLAAAVRAWQAVTDLNGKTPKQMLMKWLREHAAEFGMTDEEGKPNETAIDEAAKMANWQPGGGAPKTPG